MKLEFGVFPRSNSPGFLIYRTAALLRAGLGQAFQEKGFNVTPDQWAVLSSLWEAEGVHQSVLSRKTAKDRHNIARILKLLEKKGLVSREPHRGDKRCLVVRLTQEGKELTPKLIPIVTEFSQQAFEGLTQGDLPEMKRILSRILENLGGEPYDTTSFLECDNPCTDAGQRQAGSPSRRAPGTRKAPQEDVMRHEK